MKQFYLKTLLVILCTMTSLPSFSNVIISVDGICYNLNTTDKTASVTYNDKYGNKYNYYKKYVGDIIIRSSINYDYDGNTYNVTTIGEYAFANCSGLTSITIPNTVKTIGSYAFWCCSGLTSITIPNSVTTIEGCAFQGCSSLNKVEIRDLAAWCSIHFSNGDSNPLSMAKHLYLGVPNYLEVDNVVVDTLWDYYECNNVIIPQNVKAISDYAFINCESIETIEFPYGLENIGFNSFSGCSSLTSLTISNSVTEIGAYAFYRCRGLTSISISDSVTIIGSYAFNGCTNLTSVTIPNSVTSIGEKAFENCSNLTKVFLNSNQIVSKESSSLIRFFGTEVKEYIIGDSVKSIGAYAFYGCSGMIRVTISDGVTSIGSYAFQNCSGLIRVNISDGVTSIGSYAFQNCSGLKSITFSSSITSIDMYAFTKCSNLEKVVITDIAAWCEIKFGNTESNPLYYAHHIFSDEDSEITELVIPDGVTTIKNAFYGCSGLTSVTIPNSVTAIYGQAFEGCSGLEKVIIPDNVVSIGGTSFDKSTKLYVNSNTISLLTLWKNGYTPYLVGTEELLEPPYLSVLSTTQTTAVLGLNSEYTGYDYYIDYKRNYDGTIDGTIFSDKELELTNLIPGTKYSKTLTVVLNEGDQTFTYSPSPTTFTTQSMEPSLEFSNTATSYSVNGKYTKGNAHVVKEEIAVCYKKQVRADRISREPKSPFWRDPKSGTYKYGDQYYDYYFQTDGSKTIDGNVRSIYHLEPNTNMKDSCLVYRITIEYDDLSRDSSTAVAIYPHTLPLELTTLQPRVATPGNVIVAAQSNIDDSETNVGFEWRRTDWTDDFPSNSGQAYLYEGGMEGYIRNLNTEKLWKYRPYFESAAGNRYYGEWMGLDPTNTSYFEPTVHTYASVNVEGNTANVQGYAMRGSDNTAQQGFKYWEETASSRATAPGRVSVPSNAQTITADGVVMQAALTNLDYETTYCYVAFVTTTEGETFYGDQRQFTTDVNPAGIEESVADKAVAIPVAYYDLNGRRLQTPQSGLVIARMSDGTSRKMIVK